MMKTVSTPLLKIPPLVSLYEEENLSPRTANLMTAADTGLRDLSKQLNQRGKSHIAGILKENYDIATKPLYKIITDEEDALLRQEKVIVTQLLPENGKVKKIDRTNLMKLETISKHVCIKTLRGEELSPLEKAVSHFNLQQKAMRYLNHLQNQCRANWIKQRAVYNPANNGEYPIRNLRGEMLGITQISAQCLNKFYSAKGVKPFVSKKLSHDERAALYAKLTCRTFEEKDKQSEFESALVGQMMVVAKEEIPKGTCLGVYGGTLIKKADVLYLNDDSYALKASEPKDGDMDLIDGDNILSRMNSTFDYSEEGKPYRQASDVFNVDSTFFQVTLTDGTDALLAACFARKAIAAGEELRMDYGYGPEEIKRKIAS